MRTAETARRTLCVLLAAAACGESVAPGDGLPARLDPIDGNGQRGVVGEPLPRPLVVRVVDRSGAGLPEVTVVFIVIDGGGSVLSSGGTDEDGRAQAMWTLGPTGGEQTVQVRIPGSESVPAAVFRATATPAAPATFAPVSGDGQSRAAGQALRDSLVVRITDSFGNGVPGLRVDWRTVVGGGRVSPVSVTTGPDGQARTQLTLGTQPGANLAAANTVGFDSVTFSSLATPPPVLTSVTPDTLVPGQTVTLSGTDFARTAADTEVRVAGSPASILVATQERVEAVVPCVPSGAAALALTTNGVRLEQAGLVAVSPVLRLDAGQSATINGPRPGCAEIASSGAHLILVSRPAPAGLATIRVRGQPGGPSTAAALQNSPNVGAQHTVAGNVHDHILAAAEAVLARHLPRAEAPSRAEDPFPGDTVTMLVPDVVTNACTIRDEVRARVVARGARTLVLEDIDAPLATRADSVITLLHGELENIMLPLLEEHFGNGLAVFTGPDGARLRLLLSPSVNQLSGVSGFTSVGDLTDPASCAASNGIPVFYGFVPTDPAAGYGNGIALTRSNWLRLVRATVVHETKHLIAFATRIGAGVDRLEERWLEEGAAMVAEELYARQVFGYGRTSNVSFRASLFCERRPDSASFPECRDKPLVMLNHFTLLARHLSALESRSLFAAAASNDNSFYGAAWSFLRWTLDQHAPDEAAFLRTMTADVDQLGRANLEARTGSGFDALFAEWLVALALDDRAGYTAGDPRQTFPGWNLRDIYAGLQQELPLLFPRAYPLAPRTSAAGTFDVQVRNLPGGTGILLEVGALTNARQLIDITMDVAEQPRVTVVRLN